MAKGKNAAGAFKASRAARFAEAAEARMERMAAKIEVVPEAEVRDTDEVMHREGGFAMVRRD